MGIHTVMKQDYDEELDATAVDEELELADDIVDNNGEQVGWCLAQVTWKRGHEEMPQSL